MNQKKLYVLVGLALFSSITFALPKAKNATPVVTEKDSAICQKLHKDILTNLKNIASFTAQNLSTALPQRTGKMLFELEINNAWHLIHLSYSLVASNNCKEPDPPTELLQDYINKAKKCVVTVNDIAVFNKPVTTSTADPCKREEW